MTGMRPVTKTYIQPAGLLSVEPAKGGCMLIQNRDGSGLVVMSQTHLAAPEYYEVLDNGRVSIQHTASTGRTYVAVQTQDYTAFERVSNCYSLTPMPVLATINRYRPVAAPSPIDLSKTDSRGMPIFNTVDLFPYQIEELEITGMVHVMPDLEIYQDNYQEPRW